MTEQEKAKELVEKYEPLLYQGYGDLAGYIVAKECALVDIDNTIEALEYHSWQNRKQIEYYKEIRTHIIEMK